MSNWYVMQVNTGKERSIQAQCLKMISRVILPQVMIPTYSYKFRTGGEWTDRRNILFPGYVFLVTDDPKQVMTELHKVIGMTRILGADEELLPITDFEKELICHLCGDDGNANVSEGIIEGNKVVVTNGPLKGLESQIVKIDRHKRAAWISLEMFGREQEVQVGLEVVRKI